MKKRLAILGSTGSIGTQVLDVVDANPELFSVEILTAYNNVDLLIQQALKYKPKTVVIANEENYDIVSDALDIKGIEVFSGELALQQVVQSDTVDMVLAAMVGYAGLLPVISAIKAKKEIALANKETLVVAGDLMTRLCKEYGVKLLPVDSEHSAIFQCLVGEQQSELDKIILTCSGGPFRGFTKKNLEKVTRKEALDHPNWDMGAKITIDSATLMNKGFEVIEAKWLFDLKVSQIDVVVHPQSIIHSLVQFTDGSLKAQIGLPDMRLPIHYAMCYPNRVKNNFPRFNFLDYPELTFSAPDTEIFRNLALDYEALEKGGNVACIINAANEVVVKAFLEKKVGFLQMSDVIEQTMQKIAFIPHPSINDYITTDKEARCKADELVGKLKI
ncbi:MAG: 1-deoxy-D-xylulose-5-phosphate reductoisomerase [Prolixibacteraceae bacterium]|jgi:1-deoxy-D-xylulose-5-phosphate reductoisomerase|nr:1-deoxy-D-xylulose-5-phosphate reductoisomerase [Prolixibacteraceae bacterium]